MRRILLPVLIAGCFAMPAVARAACTKTQEILDYATSINRHYTIYSGDPAQKIADEINKHSANAVDLVDSIVTFDLADGSVLIGASYKGLACTWAKAPKDEWDHFIKKIFGADT